MKTKSSFILKSGISLILCFLMLFGTMTSSLAAVVDNAEVAADADLADVAANAEDVAYAGANVDLASTGYRFQGAPLYFIAPDDWDLSKGVSIMADSDKSWTETYAQNLTRIGDTRIFYFSGSIGKHNDDQSREMNFDNNDWFCFINESNWGFGWGDQDRRKYASKYTTCETGWDLKNGKAVFSATLSSGKEYTLSGTYYSDADFAKAYSFDQTFRMQYRLGTSGSYSNASSYAPGTAKLKTSYWDNTNYNSGGTAEKDISTTDYVFERGVKSATVTLTASANTGFDFDGIYKSGSTTKLNSGATYTISAANTYYARFTAKSYTISYVTNGGSWASGYTAPASRYYTQSATLPTSSNISKTGYNFGGWYTNSGLTTSAGTSISATSTTNYTLYAKWTPKTTTVTLNRNGGSGGSASVTATYNAAMPAATMPTRTGYTFNGYWTATSGGTQYYDADGASVKTWDITDSTKTLYAQWSEDTVDVKVQAKTNGEVSTTGGTVDQTTVNVGIATKATVKATAKSASGYALAGWEVSGPKASSVRLYTNEGCTTAYTGSESPQPATIYIRTNGDSDITTTTIVSALFVTDNREVVTGKMLMVDSAGYSVANASEISPTITGAGSYSAVSGSEVTLTATEPAGYKFIGWYSASETKTTAAANQTLVSTDKTYKFNMSLTANLNYYAMYKKVYELTVFDSYEEDKLDEEIFVTAAPKTIKVTTGSTTVTYTYAAGSYPDKRGDSHTVSGGGTYYEGNHIQVLAGDKVEMIYSALSTSDTIMGAFYNNDINDGQRVCYTVSGQTSTADDLIPHAFDSDHALFADVNYYNGANATTIGAQTYDATIDQNTHTVTIASIGKSYYNIDLEIGTKRRVYFSDTDNTVIHSKNLDNYYSVNEQLSGDTAATKLTVKAAGNAGQINTIKKTSIAVYRADDEGKPTGNPISGITATFSSGTSIANSGATASTETITFTGNMPNYDIYIDLGLEVTYNMYLGSKVANDPSTENKVSLAQLGTVNAVYYNDAEGTSVNDTKQTGNTVTGPKALTAGKTVKYTYTFSGDWGKYYEFLGWYEGSATAPDYSKQLSTKQSFTYKPKAHTYVWAVGTRAFYIVGNFKYSSATDTISSGNWQNYYPMLYDGDKKLYYFDFPNITIGTEYQFKITLTEGKLDDGSLAWWKKNQYDSTNLTAGDTSKINYGRYGKSIGTGADNGSFQVTSTQYNNGYDAPVRIYFNSDTGVFTAEPTYFWKNIYVSGGYKGIDSSKDTKDTYPTVAGTNSTTISEPIGNGFDRDYELVKHYRVKKKNGTVKITKTVENGYKVSAFELYGVDTDSVEAVTNVKDEGSNKWSAEITVTEDMYIVPIIEKDDADMTVLFDAAQLNTKEWGDMVSCYAWYSDGSAAYGDYPGQLMVISDDHSTWKAKFPSKKGDAELVGITFANYFEGKKTWFSTTYPQTVGEGQLIKLYNELGSGDYHQTNFKAQTYDYREPIASYEHRTPGVPTTISFSIKEGNFQSISLRHSELVGANIFQPIDHKHSDNKITTGEYTYTQDDFEYLTNRTGEKYVDLNGRDIEGKPAASFYVVTKGMVSVVDSNIYQVFYSGNNRDKSGESYFGPAVPKYDVSGVSMKYAVQWYIYDASGNYITNILSAAYADLTDGNTRSLVAQKLIDLGYAVDERSVKISYDTPRYCNNDKQTASGATNAQMAEAVAQGDGFNCYRFTGQWYVTTAVEPVTVNVRVGMRTEVEDVLYDTNSAACGSAKASYDASKGSTLKVYRDVVVVASDNSYVTTAMIDADNHPILLTADPENFIGWYYYDSEGNFVKAKHDSATGFYPSYTKDTTFYAMYEAKGAYNFIYIDRFGQKKTISYPFDLTPNETEGYANNGNRQNYPTYSGSITYNTVSYASLSELLTYLLPSDVDVNVYQTDVSFKTTAGTSAATFDAALKTKYFGSSDISGIPIASNIIVDEYAVNIYAEESTKSYNLTYNYYKSAEDAKKAGNGGTLSTGNVTVEYNTAENSKLDTSNIFWPGDVTFLGWSTAKDDPLKIASQFPSFGMTLTKNTTIYTVYGAAPTTETWTASIDDVIASREKTTSTTTSYLDFILRFTSNKGTLLKNQDTDYASYGVIVLTDSDGISVTGDNLSAYASDANKQKIYDALKNQSDGYTRNLKKADKTTATIYFGSKPNNFNRLDIAVMNDYANVKDATYRAYAFFQPSGGTVQFSEVVSGTYQSGPSN